MPSNLPTGTAGVLDTGDENLRDHLLLILDNASLSVGLRKVHNLPRRPADRFPADRKSPLSHGKSCAQPRAKPG